MNLKQLNWIKRDKNADVLAVDIFKNESILGVVKLMVFYLDFYRSEILWSIIAQVPHIACLCELGTSLYEVNGNCLNVVLKKVAGCILRDEVIIVFKTG